MRGLLALFLLALAALSIANSGGAGKKAKRSFVIDYENNRFLKDGQPYRYISGSIHYFRVHEGYWNDRLAKMKAGGLNAIEFYIPWNYHELYPDQFYFAGNANVTKFIHLAQKNGLDVILRMGPYTCGELDNGGIPWWLMQIAPKAVSRTNDPLFLYYVNKWYFKLIPMIEPLLYKNGGPVIMLQVENEYGSYFACDRNYMMYLRDLFRSYVGDEVVLFTVDGGADYYLKCGYTPGLYPTVDFGPGTYAAINGSFEAERQYSSQGPLVNTEFYPGWLDVWGENHSTVATKDVLDSMSSMWSMGASFNFYMFHGGTTFGFWNGATGTEPCTTSYDYDAPLSEAADPTSKYMAIRDLIQNLTGIPNKYPVPKANPKRNYGPIETTLIGTIIDLLHLWSDRKNETQYPLTFEAIGHPYGYVLYETTVPVDIVGQGDGNLTVVGIRDRGYVMVDGETQGILDNRYQKYYVIIEAKKGQKLQILVENMGRHTQALPEPKGIVANVTLDERVLTDWTLYPISMDDLFVPMKADKPRRALKNIIKSGSQISSKPKRDNALFTPSVYFAKFILTEEPQDTFFHPGNWSKGQLFLNEFNVGRYWPSLGPQVTLYVPKTILHPGPNFALMIEFEKPGNCVDDTFHKCAFSLVDQPYLNKSVTYTGDDNRRERPTKFRHVPLARRQEEL